MTVVLRFLLCDAWEGPSGDFGLLLRIRKLAGRWQLPKLVQLADARLLRQLRPTTLLQLLRNTASLGPSLVRACLELLDTDGLNIMADHPAGVRAIIDERPELYKQIMQRFLQPRAAKKARHV